MTNDSPLLAEDLFKALPREATLSHRVTVELEALIIAGRLAPGTRLPSERELAEQFGVSRTVVREAVRALVAKSLLEVRPGSGTVIRAPTAESVAQSMSLFLRAGQTLDHAKIHEVRRTLEIEIAGLAAERLTEDDLTTLEALLSDMQAMLREPGGLQPHRDRYVQNDVAFHAALARATHNELFVLLLDSIADVMLEVRQMGFEVPGSHPKAFSHHQAILDQIARRNAAGAREAMRAHLIDSEEVMRRGMALHAASHKVSSAD